MKCDDDDDVTKCFNFILHQNFAKAAFRTWVEQFFFLECTIILKTSLMKCANNSDYFYFGHFCLHLLGILENYKSFCYFLFFPLLR